MLRVVFIDLYDLMVVVPIGPSSVVTLYLRSSLNSSHMSRIWLVVLVLDHGLLYSPCDTRLVYKECKLHCSGESLQSYSD